MKSVLVTGASTGIGEACALRPDRLVPVFLDVTDQAQIDAVAKQASGDGGRLRRFPPFRAAVWWISIDILAIQIWTF